MSPPVRISVARTRKVAIFVLPEDRCDIFYLFEDVAQQCRQSPGLDSVAFIAASKSNRSDALWLFKEFQANHSVPSSLLVIDEAAYAFDLLGDILRELAANRFVFVGPGVFLTKAGWARAREVLSDTSLDLVFLGMTPDPWDAAEERGGASARCFAWTTRQFLRWSAHMPSFLGGFHLDNLLVQSDGKQSTCEGAARASRRAVPDRLQAAINAEIYGSGARL